MEQRASIVDPNYRTLPFWRIIKAINFGLSISALIFFWIYNGFQHQRMFDESALFSIDFQKNHFAYRGWAWIWTNIAFGVAVVGCYFFLFFLRRKSDSLVFFLLFFLQLGTTEVVKLIMRDTRPCNKYQAIADNYCSCSFGMPSGHSSNSMLFYLLVFVHIFEDFHKEYLANSLFVIAMIVVIFNVGMSRIFYGVHSYNQVLLGYLLGYAFFSTYWLFSRRIRLIFAEALARNPSYKNTRMMVFGTIFLLFATLNALAWGFWARNIKNYEQFPNHPSFTTTCENECLKNGSWLSDDHIGSISVINAAMFLSFVIAVFRPERTISHERYYSSWWLGGFSLILRRLLVFAIVTCPILVAFILSIWFNGWKRYIIFSTLSLAFVIAFVFIYPVLSRLLNAVIPGDFFSEPPNVQPEAVPNYPERDIVDEPVAFRKLENDRFDKQ